MPVFQFMVDCEGYEGSVIVVAPTVEEARIRFYELWMNEVLRFFNTDKSWRFSKYVKFHSRMMREINHGIYYTGEEDFLVDLGEIIVNAI